MFGGRGIEGRGSREKGENRKDDIRVSVLCNVNGRNRSAPTCATYTNICSVTNRHTRFCTAPVSLLCRCVSLALCVMSAQSRFIPALIDNRVPTCLLDMCEATKRIETKHYCTTALANIAACASFESYLVELGVVVRRERERDDVDDDDDDDDTRREETRDE